MNRRRTLLACLIAVVAITAAACAGSAENRAQGDRTPPTGFRRLGGLGPGPIPGEHVSLEEARSRVQFSIPLLPKVSLPDPCSQEQKTLKLLGVWASYEVDPVEFRSVGLLHNLGIWDDISTPNHLARRVQIKIGQTNELPPAEEELPGIAVTDEVRGHVAWVTDLTRKVDCESAERFDITTPRPSPNAGEPQTSAPRPFPEATYFESESSLTWYENGVVIELYGPFPAAKLKEIVERMQFS